MPSRFGKVELPSEFFNAEEMQRVQDVTINQGEVVCQQCWTIHAGECA